MPTELVRSTLALEVQAHREALDAFLAAASDAPAATWNVARPGDRWSPAQVSEHLRLTYVTVHAELAGGDGFRVRTRGWQQRLFRFRYLPRILRGDGFPQGVPATREIRPGDGPFDREELLAALRREGERFLEAASAAHAAGRAQVTHPFLGGMSLLDGIRFTAQHIRHHQAQIGGPGAAPPDRAPRRNPLLALLGWLAASFAAAALGGFASAHAGDFYRTLARPSWAPPAWLFGPAWTVLYLLMGIAAWLVWREGGFRRRGPALTLYLVQLAVNALWTWLFFVWRLGALAFVEIVLLWVLILATAIAFRRARPLAAALLLPYLAWVTFAAALTWAIWKRNPGLLG